MRWVALVVLLGGCIQDRTVACGELECPVGNFCTAGGCASPEAVEACAGSAEAAVCAVNDFAGHCVDGACQIAKCGDGRMQFGEVCDDGNTDAGDGCSAHCDSLEVCGNGVVDPFVGEQCDGGIAGLSGDGCTSACTAEIALWSDVSPRALVGRASYTMVTDTARQRVVMYGGTTPSHQTDATTLEWNGYSWDIRTPLHSPPPRVFAMMAYDETRHRTVLFGGQTETNTQFRNDTWEWDGIDWHEIATPARPTPRDDGAMAYDPSTHRVILFGGQTPGAHLLNETWAYDGTTWTQLSPANAPQGRVKPALARAPNNKLMLVGGADGGTPFNDRWSWNGMNWVQSMASGPPARADAAIAYDPIRDRTVLYGGSFMADSWEWNGAGWTAITPSTTPPQAGVGYRMAWDPVSRRPLVFGGFTGVDINLDTWQLDVPGAAWTKVALVAPQPRMNGAIVYDSARGNVLMFGGFGGTAWGETWIWSGQRWLEVADAAASPPARVGHAMAFDEARGEVVMFGGDTTTDTWTWNGTAWTKHSTALHPSARNLAMMTYDPARQRVLLFGGSDLNGMHDDLWEWDGTTWTDRTPAARPQARRGGVFVYDRARAVSLLYGGVNGDFLGDTWTWNGTAWTQLMPVDPPKGRDGAAAVFDAHTNKVVMFGGVQISDDTFQWDGTTWSKLPIPVAPPARTSTMAAYDAVHGRIILFGGYDSGFDLQLGDTWSFGYQSSVSPPERCDQNLDTDLDGLVGCADPDCWARCDPQCLPGATGCATGRPRCGDGVCSAIEDSAICPGDCAP